MNDYKELITELDVWQKDAENCELVPPNVFRKCKYAIEQLVRERDAAIADLNTVRSCANCKFNGEDCKNCDFLHFRLNYEWRGAQSEID